jgi:hypothetical protein
MQLLLSMHYVLPRFSRNGLRPQVISRSEPNGAASALPTGMMFACRQTPKDLALCVVLLGFVTQPLAFARAYQSHVLVIPPSYEQRFKCNTEGHGQIHCGRDTSPILIKRMAECPVPVTLPGQPQGLKTEKYRTDREWALGNKLASEVEPHLELINDFFVIQYVNHLEHMITGRLGLTECFTVKVVEDDDFNAYALPGGFIYVTSGLILSTDTEAELAAALAHETAHVIARHYSRIQAKRRVWGRLALAGGPAGYLVRLSCGPLLTMKLLRDAEFEADELGIEYFTASGYNAVDFTLALQKVVQDEDEPASFLERLFDDHPVTIARIKRLERLKRHLAAQQAKRPSDSNEFHQTKARISILLGKDSASH